MKTIPLYIEPCCIQKQLPILIRDMGEYGMFYSQGDWGVPKLLEAVESLVPSQGTEVMSVFVLETLSQSFVRRIERDLRMGWSQAFIIVTNSNNTQMLQDLLSPDDLDRICYCPSQPAAVHCNLWIRWSPQSSLVVSGPLTPTDVGPKRYCQYSTHYVVQNESDDAAPSIVPSRRVAQAFAPWRSMIRLHASIRGNSKYFASWL